MLLEPLTLRSSLFFVLHRHDSSSYQKNIEQGEISSLPVNGYRKGDTEARLTIEQVRGAACVHLEAASLTPTARRERYQQELDKIDYHQRRNRQACRSHTKTRMDRLLQLGIDVDQLPTCQPDDW